MKVPIEHFGRDHDSTLLYIEARNVDNCCTIKIENMRCGRKLHPQFAHMGSKLGNLSPTRLADGSELENHDDWSCVDDMESAGLLEWRGTGINPLLVLTDAGWERAHRLRRELAATRRPAGIRVQATVVA
jgi:hypothetical protein